MRYELKDNGKTQELIDNKIIAFTASKQYHLALVGERYYKVENDIKDHKNYKVDKETN